MYNILANEELKAETKLIYIFTNKVLQSGQQKLADTFTSYSMKNVCIMVLVQLEFYIFIV